MTDESWKDLALQLRKELDAATDVWISRIWIVLGVGIAIGMVGLWVLQTISLVH